MKCCARNGIVNSGRVRRGNRRKRHRLKLAAMPDRRHRYSAPVRIESCRQYQAAAIGRRWQIRGRRAAVHRRRERRSARAPADIRLFAWHIDPRALAFLCNLLLRNETISARPGDRHHESSCIIPCAWRAFAAAKCRQRGHCFISRGPRSDVGGRRAAHAQSSLGGA